ncbi:class I SAM-dependent methyltransferase [Erwinia sp. HR93]|uniref:class I SAM-dependent methyltransferase n=1 Tax=Erwinia sp. HR93 TaxID=3094840 RepID=UPI002ADEA746|nr:class I SAM-dependent methyltransferase [Erwinia sp. HR93]MEA1063703.1 class I SAM-dependent methyltransferase [Erwinia sp. HR93]
MKPARIPEPLVAPARWAELPWGDNHRAAIERQLQPWLAKMFGFHLLKVGNLSAEINTDTCAISHQFNMALQGENLQVMGEALQLPFAPDSIDACLLAHSLPWCGDPHRLLREIDRVLIDDGWLIITGFNPLSLARVGRIRTLFRKPRVPQWRSFTLMRQIDWLALLNFEVMHCGCFEVLPWQKSGGRLLNTHVPALGCLQMIVARKRTVPLTFTPMKNLRKKPQLRPAVGATRQY